MSHLGRYGPPDIKDTYSLLILNISFRTTADDLYPLFDKYGNVVDIFIPRDRRTGDSRGFAFVRYKYEDEAQKAVDRLDGRVVDGREITVQFAKYGPNAERIYKGRIIEKIPKSGYRSRSRSPPRRYHHDYYKHRDYRRRSRSRSYDRYDSDRYQRRERDYHFPSMRRSLPDYYRDEDHGHAREHYYSEQSRSRSYDSASPHRHSAQRSVSPRRTPSPTRHGSPVRNEVSPNPHNSLSPPRVDSQKSFYSLFG